MHIDCRDETRTGVGSIKDTREAINRESLLKGGNTDSIHKQLPVQRRVNYVRSQWVLDIYSWKMIVNTHRHIHGQEPERLRHQVA